MKIKCRVSDSEKNALLLGQKPRLKRWGKAKRRKARHIVCLQRRESQSKKRRKPDGSRTICQGSGQEMKHKRIKKKARWVEIEERRTP